MLFLYSFFYVAWPYSATFSETTLSDKERLPLEFFLWMDPLSGLSAAIAARCWNVSLIDAAIILPACLFFPRGFCGWLCPLGTLIDGFDWLAGRLVRPARHVRLVRQVRPVRQLSSPGTCSPAIQNPKSKIQNLRFYLLVAVLASSLFGVLLSGFVAAIPVLTRGLLFTAGRLQLGLMKDWSQVGPATLALYLSVGMFAAIFLLSLFGPRFWCRHLCPTGAAFSAFSLFRVAERKVEESKCSGCGRCVEVCPFEAVNDNLTARPLDCAFCQTCGGACPTGAIRFTVGQVGNLSKSARNPLTEAAESPARQSGSRTDVPVPLKVSGQVANLSYSRRGFVLSTLSGVSIALAARLGFADGFRPKTKLLRPPGSLPEPVFLDLCVRCGECFKVCPGPVLHPAGLEGGFEALWTPVVVPTRAGCHQDCNFCTQVCPTRAIRPLTIAEKRKTHIGLAVINTQTCLAHVGERDCQLCFDECEAAGYHAIQMREIRLKVGEIPAGVYSEDEIEAMGRIKAPFVDTEACVGCGLCEFRCHVALVRETKALAHRAVVVVPENEDRTPPQNM